MGRFFKELYGLVPNGEIEDDDDDDRDDKHDRDDRGGKHKRGVYRPVPANYEALIPDDLKRIMEFPGFVLNDNLSKLRREYLAMGGQRSNTRYGWIRTKV